MMNKTIAQLIPTIFCLALISPASTVLAAVPGHNQWNQQPGQYSVPSSGNAYPGQPGQRLQPAPWPQVANYPNRERAYRFRPWEGGNSGFDQPQRPAIARQPFWRPATSAAFAGYPQQSPNSRYRFRPMETREKREPTPRWTYRPAQIEIPNDYVYRPLKAKQVRNSVDRRSRALPVPPAMGGYGYYGPYNTPRSGLIAPGLPAYRYPAGYAPAWRARGNPGYPEYRPQFAGYPEYRPQFAGYPLQPRVAVPRYMANMPFSRYRFRPLNQPGLQRYPYRGERARYAANPYSWAPKQPGYIPGQPYPYAGYRQWMPPQISPVPAMARAGWRPVVPNRYGVDWYDGQADGEGAWYKLAEQGQWPRVSQFDPLY